MVERALPPFSPPNAQAAQEACGFISHWEHDPVCFVDTMDDTLEALYEARPWRQYIIEAESGVLVGAIGLTPFNMAAKIKAVEAATAEEDDIITLCPSCNAPVFGNPMQASLMQSMMVMRNELVYGGLAVQLPTPSSITAPHDEWHDEDQGRRRRPDCS